MQHLLEAGTTLGGEHKGLCPPDYEGPRVPPLEQDRSLRFEGSQRACGLKWVGPSFRFRLFKALGVINQLV
jgi:hypothetical protein